MDFKVAICYNNSGDVIMKKNILEYNIEKEYELLDFLYSNIKNSKNNIKSFLKNGKVYVNGKIITKYNYLLKENDKVLIKLFQTDLDILYEDNDLIIVSKPSGLLTVDIDKGSGKTLYKEVSNYIKRNNKKNKIFIVNRLDRDTSGIVVFAKSEKVKQMLQNNWNEIVLVRKYIAVVEGVAKEKDVIKSYLNENKEHMVYSAKTGKIAITEYERIKHNNKYSMLNIYLKTGRKNQIRVHMKDIGHLIIGDKKYGSKENLIDRLMLHCELIEFKNPINNKIISITCPHPIEFDSVFNV